MSEDEAFIRAIVDNPGDDTARLVYADWLDEHDDPRGAYLRAEHEAAESGDIARLQRLAADLDPVWVARVSRPPVGVCCDPRTLAGAGPLLSARDLDRFETELGLPLTGQYRAFLLNVNGGLPLLRLSNATSSGSAPPNYGFYSLKRVGIADRWSLEYQTREFRSHLPELLEEELWDAGPDDVPWQADAIPIGDSGHDFTLFYAVRGKYEGRLHLHDYTCEYCRFGWIAGPRGAPTLSEFLHRLPQSGCGLTDTYPSRPLQEFWQK